MTKRKTPETPITMPNRRTRKLPIIIETDRYTQIGGVKISVVVKTEAEENDDSIKESITWLAERFANFKDFSQGSFSAISKHECRSLLFEKDRLCREDPLFCERADATPYYVLARHRFFVYCKHH